MQFRWKRHRASQVENNPRSEPLLPAVYHFTTNDQPGSALTALRGLSPYPGRSYTGESKGLASVGCKFYRATRSALALEAGYAKDLESEIR
jgi:hypothetical protein